MPALHPSFKALLDLRRQRQMGPRKMACTESAHTELNK